MSTPHRLVRGVLGTTHGLPEGTPISAKQLLHLGSRAAVDQALSRLVKRGELLRVARGIYVLPVHGVFGTRAPSPRKMVEGLSIRLGETIAHQGADAANGLGLTTQVPMREVYWTSGATRTLNLGGNTVELRHAPAWQLVLPGRPAGEVIRAMAWLGPGRAGEAVQQAKNYLTPSELAEVLSARPHLPTWVAREVSALAVHG